MSEPFNLRRPLSWIARLPLMPVNLVQLTVRAFINAYRACSRPGLNQFTRNLPVTGYEGFAPFRYERRVPLRYLVIFGGIHSPASQDDLPQNEDEENTTPTETL